MLENITQTPVVLQGTETYRAAGTVCPNSERAPQLYLIWLFVTGFEWPVHAYSICLPSILSDF